MAKAMNNMVTLTIKEPKNCLECPVAHTGCGRVYCAGRGTSPRTLVEVDDPQGPRPKGCPLQAGSP